MRSSSSTSGFSNSRCGTSVLSRPSALDAEVAGELLADDVVDLERLRLVLHRGGRELHHVEVIANQSERPLADDDLAAARDGAQARAGVHRVADDRVLEGLA